MSKEYKFDVFGGPLDGGVIPDDRKPQHGEVLYHRVPGGTVRWTYIFQGSYWWFVGWKVSVKP